MIVPRQHPDCTRCRERSRKIGGEKQRQTDHRFRHDVMLRHRNQWNRSAKVVVRQFRSNTFKAVLPITERLPIPMPTYQYRCKQCADEFEKVQSFSDDSTPKCPTCGTRSKKNISKVFGKVGISFKGSGFYKNDSAGKKTSTSSKPDSSSSDTKTEKTPASSASSTSGSSSSESSSSSSSSSSE